MHTSRLPLWPLQKAFLREPKGNAVFNRIECPGAIQHTARGRASSLRDIKHHDWAFGVKLRSSSCRHPLKKKCDIMARWGKDSDHEESCSPSWAHLNVSSNPSGAISSKSNFFWLEVVSVPQGWWGSLSIGQLRNLGHGGPITGAIGEVPLQVLAKRGLTSRYLYWGTTWLRVANQGEPRMALAYRQSIGWISFMCCMSSV